LLLRAAHQDLLARVADDMTITTPHGPPIRVRTLAVVPGPATPPPADEGARSLPRDPSA